MSEPSSKRQKTEPPEMTLVYWPGMPGRGEHVRLAFEAAGVEYGDTALQEDCVDQVLGHISDKNTGDEFSPPPFAPPILRHGDLTISQVPNILLYLGPKLGLVPENDPNGVYYVNSLALTALDGLSNEAHDVHHPVATTLYYEDQKDEALRKAEDYRNNRLPKFLGYFERVLSSEPSKGGEYLYAGQLTYADLVLFQCLDGVTFAFPNYIKKVRDSGKYPKVWALYERVKAHERIKDYLASKRRQEYSLCIWRNYPELDEQV
jgi:glutathione S-transferase